MIGAVMVWKVKDTYKAMFDIDSSSISISSNKSFISLGESSELSQRMQNYENFVQIQSDAAIRKIAGMYAYDYNESKDPVTLRSDDGEVAQKLDTCSSSASFVPAWNTLPSATSSSGRPWITSPVR